MIVVWRLVATSVSVFTALGVLAQALPHRVLLIPLDDRPATTQYAQWMGDMAGVTVDLPPSKLLGRFTQPGQPEAILAWMDSAGLKKYDAVILSSDMIAYGGLIASRTDRTSVALASKRLQSLWRIRNRSPRVPFFVFSAIMRLAPTATRESAPWRQTLARYEEIANHPFQELSLLQASEIDRLRKVVGATRLLKYESTRERDHKVQIELVRMVKHGAFNQLVLGQDDAQPNGPHVSETLTLREITSRLRVGSQVSFVQGVDQISSCLLSRALTLASNWTPKIRIRLADDQGGAKIASYESQPVLRSMKDQIEMSGAVLATTDIDYDYTLYINTPEPRSLEFNGFLKSLKLEVDQGMPVAVADINLGRSGTGDLQLFNALLEADRAAHLLGYSGWNTAGNTMGTAIPAANIYLLGRRGGIDPLQRESALRRFLLHRLVADFQYHRFVRPAAYQLIDADQRACRDEVYGNTFDQVQAFVEKDLSRRLNDVFVAELKDKPFFAGNKTYRILGLEAIKVNLPWPRAYEARLEFKLNIIEAKP